MGSERENERGGDGEWERDREIWKEWERDGENERDEERNIGVGNGNGQKDVIREEKKWIKRQKDRKRKGVKSVIKEADEISISSWISHLSLEISLLELLYSVVITI